MILVSAMYLGYQAYLPGFLFVKEHAPRITQLATELIEKRQSGLLAAPSSELNATLDTLKIHRAGECRILPMRGAISEGLDPGRDSFGVVIANVGAVPVQALRVKLRYLPASQTYEVIGMEEEKRTR